MSGDGAYREWKFSAGDPVPDWLSGVTGADMEFGSDVTICEAGGKRWIFASHPAEQGCVWHVGPSDGPVCIQARLPTLIRRTLTATQIDWWLVDKREIPTVYSLVPKSGHSLYWPEGPVTPPTDRL